ncbi:MAG TPA: molybdopterin dinucleotide binding domain-containing protein, partial [Ancylobacter sp.]
HAALSAFENDGDRDFDLGGLKTLDDTAFDVMAPVQWPVRSADDTGEKRFFANGNCFTPDRKARFVVPETTRLASSADADFPFSLNTGRIRDQWHTMTRTGLSPRLGAHLPVPFVEIHPLDAGRLGIEEGGLVALRSPHGSAVLEARLSDGQKPGALFAPIHWSGATSSNARINELVAGTTDPVSGQPESKATPVQALALDMPYRGFILSRAPVAEVPAAWWAKVAVEGGEGYLIATDQGPEEWQRHTAGILKTRDYAEYVDAPGGVYRAAAFDETGALIGAVFLSPSGAPASWDGLKALLAARTLSSSGRRNLLSGRSDDGMASHGPLVCACFAVSASQIAAALATEPGADVQRLGQMLRAGTNCGSCVPELKKLVRQHAASDMAAAMPPA